MVDIDTSLSTNKCGLLQYFRARAIESQEELTRLYGAIAREKLAKALNTANISTRDNLLTTLRQKSTAERWTNEEILRCVLMINYTNYIVMIECRNEVWPYDYMSFSRRIGELWEPFCKICFEYPIKALELYLPPLFSDVQRRFTREIEGYIDTLTISEEQKVELKRYYNKVWSFVDSGEIKLESDLHFRQDDFKYVVDFKSGFGSNEKGNTNRLLLVATIYKNLEEDYRCVLLVRADEDQNNNYFKTLKNSGVWEAYCGQQAYEWIRVTSGFNLSQWITDNINWDADFHEATMQHIRENNLGRFLRW